MTRKELFGVSAAGVFAAGIAGCFVGCPVFADDNPVDISIVEVVDDGAGGYKAWEDITGAVPGMTYSAIPRVKNDGEMAASVKMCLSQSATNSNGDVVSLPGDAFGIEINQNWTPESTISDPTNPATGNCYNYNSMLEVGAVTEPLFTEVTLSSALGNEYENNTFNLHLDAIAVSDEDIAPINPGSPDTGINTAEYLATISPILFSVGAIVLFAAVAYFLRSTHKN